MNYLELISEIESRTGKLKYYGSQRMERILHILGDPQKGMEYFHIAGTNGKGSVSNYIKEVLCEKYQVGFFTSPHLISYCDRIRIGNEMILQEDFVRLGEKVLQGEKQIVKDYDQLSLFEMITAIALLYFREQHCDYVVFEVGMGGRFDSTNVIDGQDKLVSIITSISFDHMSFLGETIEEIAWQKAGIVTEGGLCVTSNRDEKILRVIEKECDEKGATLIKTGNIPVFGLESTLEKTSFDFDYLGKKHLDLAQIGAYQVENSILAYVALEKLKEEGKIQVEEEEIRKGFQRAFWPGRMELISKDPKILLDGAHNSAGIEKLIDSLKSFSFRHLYVILSILSDKEHEKMINDMAGIATKILIAPIEYKRGTDGEKLQQEAKKAGIEAEVMTLDQAIAQAVDEAEKQDLILVTGSLYFVSEARAKILEFMK